MPLRVCDRKTDSLVSSCTVQRGDLFLQSLFAIFDDQISDRLQVAGLVVAPSGIESLVIA